jgi:hypothetical protein
MKYPDTLCPIGGWQFPNLPPESNIKRLVHKVACHLLCPKEEALEKILEHQKSLQQC